MFEWFVICVLVCMMNMCVLFVMYCVMLYGLCIVLMRFGVYASRVKQNVCCACELLCDVVWSSC